ncbi:hypothetical protein [Streptomyces caniscabiei]|jgi:hypothetical protein|uniref:hypothetical protein n=1 Tax=Streptomyces caniscabiei TaxID=2746961 RepID=UPI0018730065|nr:hypothetical protein [Streptomyces caniscabiei]MBE4735686.1 hypothetical protein [Streptomyces caniscabiei]
MAPLLANRARARVNHGRWIADCPRRYCANAVRLTPRQGTFHCAGEGGCQMIAPIDWPPDAEEIWNALMERPVPGTRNWYPDGHTEAVRMGLPHGQTPEELQEETRHYEAGEAG